MGKKGTGYLKKGIGWEKVKMGRKVLKLNYGGDMVNGDVNG